MKRFFGRGFRKHALFLGIFAVYLLSANSLYARYFVTQGKPAETNIRLPAASEAAVVKVGYLRMMRVEGQDVYELAGFAFLRSSTSVQNRIRVVLQGNDGTNLVFSTHAPTAPAMVQSSGYRKMGVEHSEFRALISKYAIPPGLYEVGILLDQPRIDPSAQQPGALSGPRAAYTLSGATILRTPNTISYDQPPDPAEPKP